MSSPLSTKKDLVDVEINPEVEMTPASLQDGKESPLSKPQQTDSLSGSLERRRALSDDDSYYEDSIAGDYETEGKNDSTEMTPQDLEIFRVLDQEYEMALEERDVSFQARSQSVRQSACFAVSFMGILLFVSIMVFMGQAENWEVGDALLFSIYTITTVGYGNLRHPETPTFQLYTIFFILVGIATLTIMVAQVYQWLALEASRAQQNRDMTTTVGGFITTNLPSQTGQDSNHSGMVAHHHRYTSTSRIRGTPGPAHSARNAAVQIGDFLNVPTHMMDRFFAYAERLQVFLKEDEIGRGISVLFPFCTLIVIGAAVVGSFEGWTAAESLYYSVVSLTTVGFGDYAPSTSASKWFCVFWLPWSIGFMSLYLTSVAGFYIRLSDKNIARIDRQLRRRVERAKRRAREERDAARHRALRGQEAHAGSVEEGEGRQPLPGLGTSDSTVQSATLDSGIAEETDLAAGDSSAVSSIASRKNGHRRRGFDTVPSTDSPHNVTRTASGGPRKLFGMRGTEENRRESILKASQVILDDDSAREVGDSKLSVTITTMRDIINKVRFNLEKNEAPKARAAVDEDGQFRLTEAEFFSVRSSQTLHDTSLRQNRRKPSFALRVLVQERFAEIIATDVAGCHDSVEIHDHTLSIRIASLKETADRWKVPRRARKAFRAVAFEVLFFVGEYGLVTRGAEALYDLTPLVFHGLFAPLLAALGDAEMMEAWLVRTQVLADVDLRRSLRDRGGVTGETVDPLRTRRVNPRDRTSSALPTRNKQINITAGVAMTKIR